MSKDNYVYPAILTYDDDGISVEFPDLPGCLTCGQSVQEAFSSATEALSLHLYGMEEDNDVIPEPSSLTDLQSKIKENQVLILIEVWMPVFRDKMDNKATSTTVTIPRWLKTLAEKEKINFSYELQDTLKNKLGVFSPPSRQTKKNL